MRYLEELEGWKEVLTVLTGFIVLAAGITFVGDGTEHTAWDCTFQENDVCVETSISEYRSCDAEDDRPRQEHCRTTSQSIESVTMFTDPANYIDSPMTGEEYEVESLDIGQNRAWDAEFLDNGNFLYTEMDGSLVLHNGDEQLETAQLEGTEQFGNTGLLGVAADPGFEENRYVYLYYFTGDWREIEPDATDILDPIYNRVSRFEFRDGELRNEEILIDNIEGSSGHSGGRLSIGPDGYLYVTTGDSEYGKTEYDELHQKIQDRDFLGGKVLRTDLDGEVPETNPYDGSYVYAEGFRNPQGVDFHPETGEPYVSMHGPWRYDEVNRVEAGRNYGWPAKKCGYDHLDTEVDENVEPVYCFDSFTIAPSGTTFIDDEEHPWYGNYFVTGLRGSMLYSIDLTGEQAEGEIFYIRETDEIDSRLRNVEYHNGSLYLFGDGYGVGKLTPEGY